MKTILFVIHKMTLGGTEKALLSLLEALHNHPVRITLLVLEKGGMLTDKIPKAVEVRYLEEYSEMMPVIENPPHITILNSLKTLQFIKAVRFLKVYFRIKATGDWHHIYEALLKNHPHFGAYDIAVAFAGPSDFITFFIHQKVAAKSKIQWIHFDIEKVVANFNFGKKFYPSFNKVYCVSESATCIFLKHFPQLADRTHVFHNILSEKAIKIQSSNGESYNDDYKGIRILTVGRFTKEKGYDLVLSAAERLKGEQLDFRWYCVGDGLEKAKISKMAVQMGISKEIIFLGEKANPYGYMRDCDIYVQPSLHEGYGITVAEAKIFGKPIVVTNFASAKDLINHNENGLIAKITAESVFEQLIGLIKNPELQQKFRNNLNREKTTADNDKIDLLLQI